MSPHSESLPNPDRCGVPIMRNSLDAAGAGTPSPVANLERRNCSNGIHTRSMTPELLVYCSGTRSNLPHIKRRSRNAVPKRMPSLAHVIQTFRSGALSPSEFLAQIDRVLAANQSDSAGLLEVLSEEHTKYPLPSNVYAEAHRRIEHSAESNPQPTADETYFQESPGERPAFEPSPSPTDLSGDQSLIGSEPTKGVGDTLNCRFVLQECLGVGGMGTVYKALDLRKLEASDRSPHIAIKILNVQFRGHPKSLIALQREAKKAQTLAHANIVTVYDFDRDGSLVYLTMEYLSGKPLSQVLRAPGYPGMPFAEALPIISGMARALAYAHERGLVHCDFKPANVFLTDSGQVKVIDFGIARAFDKPGEESDATIFDAGSLGGMTPAYASPEMLDHLEPDPRDDIYALACISYELLTGRHPFGRLSATQARAAGSKPLRPKNLGLRQWRVLKAALSFDRETRTPTVARFLEEMSGEHRQAVSVGVVASSILAGVISAAGLSYYWQSRTAGGDKAQSAETARVPSGSTLDPLEKTVVPSEAPPQPSVPTLSLASVLPILAGVPCSALAGSVHDNALMVQGFLPESFGIARLKDTLSKVPGVNTLSTDIQLVGDDKCSVLKQLAPYWKTNRQAGAAASIYTKGGELNLTEDNPLILDIKTPGYDSYVNVDYYLVDGNVFHLLPKPGARDQKLPPNSATTIGSDGEWVISKPLGTELIVLLTTPAPLFDGVRPQYESASDYLRALEQRLRQLSAKYGPEKVAVDLIQITTKPRTR